jgi:hypothetical protein
LNSLPNSFPRALALAYWHLPLVALAALTGISWKWLALVGVFPWLGMATPFLMAVLVPVIVLIPGLREGHPPPWLAPPMPLIIVLVIALGLFLPLYGLTLSRAVRSPAQTKRRWVIVLVLWTLLGNAAALLSPPRWASTRAPVKAPIQAPLPPAPGSDPPPAG